MTRIYKRLLGLINEMFYEDNAESLKVVQPADRLREDLYFDSYRLAEFTVRVEQMFGIDIFEDGAPATVQDVAEKLMSRLPNGE